MARISTEWSMSDSVIWWLRWPSALRPTASRAPRVRRLMGWPSITWVPAVTMGSGAPASMAPAITERAALPVHRVTRPGPARDGRRLGAYLLDMDAGDGPGDDQPLDLTRALEDGEGSHGLRKTPG